MSDTRESYHARSLEIVGSDLLVRRKRTTKAPAYNGWQMLRRDARAWLLQCEMGLG